MIRKILITFILFFPFVLCLGQDTDVQLWLTANVRKDLGKKFRLYYEQGYRRDENLTKTKTFTFETGGFYKPWKFLWVGAYYRHYDDFKDYRDNTLTGIILLREELDRFDFRLKSRYLYEFSEGKDPNHYLRERISVGYDIPKFKINPFVSSEITFHFQPDNSETEQLRYYIGGDYQIAKHHAIDFYYRYSHEMNVKNPLKMHTIGFDYVFDF